MNMKTILSLSFVATLIISTHAQFYTTSNVDTDDENGNLMTDLDFETGLVTECIIQCRAVGDAKAVYNEQTKRCKCCESVEEGSFEKEEDFSENDDENTSKIFIFKVPWFF